MSRWQRILKMLLRHYAVLLVITTSLNVRRIVLSKFLVLFMSAIIFYRTDNSIHYRLHFLNDNTLSIMRFAMKQPLFS